MEDRIDTVEREIVLDAGIEHVWDEMTDPGRVGEWFGADIEWELEAGGRATFTFPDGRVRPALVDRVVERREIAFHYLPIERDVDGRTTKVPGSAVEILLTPEGRDRTRVRVVETTSFTVAHPRFMPPSLPRRWGFRSRLSV